MPNISTGLIYRGTGFSVQLLCFGLTIVMLPAITGFSLVASPARDSHSDMTGLIIMLLALWLACEICAADYNAPRPKDPYKLDRWRNGEPPTRD